MEHRWAGCWEVLSLPQTQNPVVASALSLQDPREDVALMIESLTVGAEGCLSVLSGQVPALPKGERMRRQGAGWC